MKKGNFELSGFKNIKKIEEFYDTRAKKTDAAKAAGQWKQEELIPEICKEICKKIGLNVEHKVLEIGCGSGVLGSRLEENSKFYCGFDLSFMMLQKFLEQKKANLIQSVTHLIPFIDNSFDVIVMNGVTMYLHDDKMLQETFNEIKRVISKNGTIFIGESITPEGFYWELTWFNKASKFKQKFLKLYIDFRRWLAHKNKKFAGKWKALHRDIPISIMQNNFGHSNVKVSDSASQVIRKKYQGKSYNGNRRVDFVIKFR